MCGMKNILLAISFFVIVIVLGAAYHLWVDADGAGVIQIIQIGEVEFEVEIADSPVEQIRGLSGRREMVENEGMLFVFPEIGNYSFWMKGMLFPLDIVWIQGDEVVGVSHNLPPAAEKNPPVYSPPFSVDKILEINAGLADEHNIQIGDKAIFGSRTSEIE